MSNNGGSISGSDHEDTRDVSHGMGQDQVEDEFDRDALEREATMLRLQVGNLQLGKQNKQTKHVFLAAHVLSAVTKGGKLPSGDMFLWKEEVRDMCAQHDKTWITHAAWSVQTKARPESSRVARWESAQKAGSGIRDPPVGDSLSNHMGDTLRGGDLGPFYLDANTGLCESSDDRKYRVAFWGWVKASLVHHVSMLDGVPRYDVAALVALVLATFDGDRREAILDNIVAMTKLKLKPQQWPTLAREVTRLHSEMGQVVNLGLTLPADVLPAFVLRAVDGDADFAVPVAKLREGRPSVEQIVYSLSTRDNQLRAARPSLQGYAATGPAETKKDRPAARPDTGNGVCFKFAAGKCNYGDDCRFTHTLVGGECLSCGSKAHGYDDCKNLRRAAGQKAEVLALRAEISKIKAGKKSRREGKEDKADKAKDKPRDKEKSHKRSKKKKSSSDEDETPVKAHRATANPFDVYGGSKELTSLWRAGH